MSDPIVVRIRAVLGEAFPGEVWWPKEGEFGYDSLTWVKHNPKEWRSGVLVQPAEHERWGEKKPQAVHLTYELSYGNPTGKSKQSTRYPLSDGKFNEEKLVARVRAGLQAIEEDKLRQERELAKHNEEQRQYQILMEEIKGSPLESERGSIVRYERDGKVLYNVSGVSFYGLSKEQLVALFEAGRKTK